MGYWLVAVLLVIGRPSPACRHWALLALLAAIGPQAGCGDQDVANDPECRDPGLTIDSGLASCWIHDCPESPGAAVCGSCVNPGHDVECPPGFVCSCAKQCVRGPRSYDGGGSCLPSPPADAGPEPDARTYAWPLCDDRHLPCSN